MLRNGIELGRYRIVSLIRRGGMSEVYLANDMRMSRQVAIKTIENETSLYPEENTKQEVSRLFQREMSIVANLYHPHILQLYDFGEEKVEGVGLTYMVMPFHAEGSLVDWLRQRGKGELLAVEDVVGLILQAADALQYAHDRQIMHLDVKPSNFLVRARKEKPEQPDLFLADFGIAKVSATSKDSSTMRGTLEYMAPEQWDGHPVAASDQYALAIMTHELLTGSVPFRGNMSQIMFKHFQEMPQLPSKLNPRVSPIFDAIILRALAKKPEARFASVSEFAHALQQALPASNEIRATLVISKEEARDGAARTLTLPGGRKITVTIPAGTRDGQLMRFTSEGKLTQAADPTGILQLTIIVKPREENVSIRDGEYDKKTGRAVSIAPLDVPVPDQVPAALEATVLSSSASMQGRTEPTFYLNEGIKWSLFSRWKARGMLGKLVLTLIAISLVIASFIGFGTYRDNVKRAEATATASAKSTAIARATATVVAYPSYFPGRGTLMFYDPLSEAYIWSEGSTPSFGGSCSFEGGALHIRQTKTKSLYDCTSSTNYSDFAFQVQMTILQGDCGGIDFRDDGTSNKAYDFVICQDGSYYLYLYTSSTTSSTLISSSIGQQLNKTNSIAIITEGTSTDLYVNNRMINSTIDATYSSGEIGLIADAKKNATEVVYSDAKMWTF